MTRAWGFHAIVVVAVLGGLLGMIADDGPTFAITFGFFFMPVALVYTLMSTLLVAVLRPGRGWVVLAHVLAFMLGALAATFFIGGR